MSRPAADVSPGTWGLMALLSLVWGTSFLSVAVALTAIPPFTVVLHRVAWAALILWGVALALGHRPPRSLRVWGALAVMGLLNAALPFTLMTWGQTQIESGLTGILNAATALFALPVAALVFPDERLTLRRVLGVLVGLSGVVLAIGPEVLGGVDPRALAQLAVVAATFSYACGASWARAHLTGLPPLVAAAGMTSAAALLVAPVALAVEGVPHLALPAEVWAAVAWYAGAATAAAFVLYYRILALAGPANLLLVTLAIPVVAVLLGAAVLGERLAPAALLGFGLVALGLAIVDGRLVRALGISPRPAP